MQNARDDLPPQQAKHKTFSRLLLLTLGAAAPGPSRGPGVGQTPTEHRRSFMRRAFQTHWGWGGGPVCRESYVVLLQGVSWAFYWAYCGLCTAT